MIVIIPNKISGVSKIEQNLEAFTVGSLLSTLNQRSGTTVAVSLPKFKMESQHKLVSILQNVKLEYFYS